MSGVPADSQMPRFPHYLPLLALWACGGSEPSVTEPPTGTNNPPTVRNVPGTYARTVTIDGQVREFIVYVGSSVGATTATPVVFMFHGSGQTGPQFYNISKWVERADQHGLIAVFASALTYCYKEDKNKDGDMTDAGEMQVETKWTSGEVNTPGAPLCSAAEIAALPATQRTAATHPFQDDLPFLDAIVTHLKTTLVIDPKRIYGTGFSNGAQLAVRLASERSTTFAALAAHGGSPHVNLTTTRPMSFAASLGNADEHVQEAYKIAQLPMSEDMLTRYPGVAATYIAPMLTMLRLSPSYTYNEVTISGKKVSQWIFRTSTGGLANSYTFSLLQDNNHAYPNGVAHPIVLAEPLWQFFQTQQLP
jgi:polyhydroxybutyrate depolymerase